jgi:hypothetical protein
MTSMFKDEQTKNVTETGFFCGHATVLGDVLQIA